MNQLAKCVDELCDFIDLVREELTNLKAIMSKQPGQMTAKYYRISECDILDALKENGCGFSANACYRRAALKADSLITEVYFIYGGSGNLTHEAYDYWEGPNDKTIIIFIDSFRNLVGQKSDKILGYSRYMDELVSIADLFTIHYRNGLLIEYYSHTAAVATWKFMPFIAAVAIAQPFVDLTKDDMSGVNPESVLEWFSHHDLKVVLAGCRD